MRFTTLSHEIVEIVNVTVLHFITQYNVLITYILNADDSASN